MKKIYQKSDFNYELPDELIASYPLEKRSASRLLVADIDNSQQVVIADKQVTDLVDYLSPNDLLVVNNTRVLPARMFGRKESGGKLEIMVERTLSVHRVKAYLRASKTPKVGSIILIADTPVIVEGKHAGVFSLYSEVPWAEIMQEQGEMPIPPYMERRAETLDSKRYQTVYAKTAGAVAAPTAGLHFDDALLQAVQTKGVETAEVTLHVGAGTFQPVREEDLSAHVMHEEWLSVPQEVVDAVSDCHARGGRVISIGTTSLRALESAAKDGELKPFQGDTNLFITPGYQFRVVDGLFTNFHLPESTLLMLVSAFAGVENTRLIYKHAIAEKYRFFSYGDSMFLPKSI